MKSPLILLYHLLADVGRWDPSVKGLDRDYLTIESRFKHEGIGFLTVALPRLGEAITRGLADGVLCIPLGFKKSGRSALPSLFKGLLSEVFDTETGYLRDDASVGAVKSLRQLTLFFKKALIAEDEEYLDTKAKETFYGCERQVLGEIPQPYLRHLIRVGHYILGSLDLDVLRVEGTNGRHGPGAVAEGVYGNGKWAALGESVRSGHDFLPECAFDLHVIDDRDSKPYSAVKFCSSGKLITVPKSTTSRRTITVEPLMNQFHQQALNRVLRSNIEKCPILKNCLSLDDQSQNQKLAMVGSHNGSFATLDLKSASDLLSTSLVEAIFRRSPVFTERMFRCRSPIEGVALRKFAGMGNATTFPVQSVCFAVLAITSIVVECEKKHLSKETCRRAAEHVRVFGDDIIVPTKYAHAVIAWIEACGLVVNRDKSFVAGSFRESCGVDAFKGVDVTPIYYRLDPRKSVRTDSQVETVVSTSNQLWLGGYYSLGTHLKDDLEGTYGKLPLVPTESGAIGWHVRGKIVLPTRWNKQLHREEFKAPSSEARRVKSPLTGVPALLKFFLTDLRERPVGHLKESVARHRNMIRRRWMPVIPVKSDFLP